MNTDEALRTNTNVRVGLFELECCKLFLIRSIDISATSA